MRKTSYRCAARRLPRYPALIFYLPKQTRTCRRPSTATGKRQTAAWTRGATTSFEQFSSTTYLPSTPRWLHSIPPVFHQWWTTVPFPARRSHLILLLPRLPRLTGLFCLELFICLPSFPHYTFGRSSAWVIPSTVGRTAVPHLLPTCSRCYSVILLP